MDAIDFTDKFNTELTSEQTRAYKQWAKKNGKMSPDGNIPDTYDYDLQGAFLAGVEPDGRLHMTDQFKKPNHPTFSTLSQYNGVDGAQGGEWLKYGGNQYFVPSQHNISNYGGLDNLQEYFSRREKGNATLIDNKTANALKKAQLYIDNQNQYQ
jgi:hypothetical protein